MGAFKCLGKCVSELLLIAINLVLILGGALVLYVGVDLRHTGWVEVVKGYWSGMYDLVTAIIVIGSVLIGFAVLGSIAALCRWRVGLCAYSIFVVLILVVFLLLAIGAFVLNGWTAWWGDTAYPASSNEKEVKADFDEVYCYAQAEYICNEASVSEAIEMFAPDLDSSIAALFSGMTGGVSGLCDEYAGLFDQLDEVCDGCDIAHDFENFTSVVDWADDKCPRTNETLVWCGQFLAYGTTNSTEGTAPYSECRDEFLHIVWKYSLYVGIGSVIVCAGAVMVFAFTCFLRRKEKRKEIHEANVAYAPAP